MKWFCSVSVGLGVLGSTAGAGPCWVHGDISSSRDFGSEVSWDILQGVEDVMAPRGYEKFL